MASLLRTSLKILLPVTVIAGSVFLAKYLISTSPTQDRKSKPPSMQTVELLTVKPQDYKVTIQTRGTVEPRTQGTLVSEVTGRILKTSPNFNSGSFFNKGDILVQIEPQDYEQTLVTVKAELSQAQAALQEAQAKTDLAQKDWDRFGYKEGQPSRLALHLPALASKKAALAAAKARIKQAETKLARTTIRAPYTGRVLKKQVDVGQYVSTGTTLASIYAVDYVEVRLPLTDQQTGFVDLPEAYQGEKNKKSETDVSLFITDGSNTTHEWKGKIVRTEGSIDVQSRQQFVIAQVDKPYARQEDNRPPLKIGQFVKAEIKGASLTDVIVLPRNLIRGEDEVIVINKNNEVENRKINILWRDDEYAVLNSGLKLGERISKTPLSFATNGMKVKVKGEKEKGEKKKNDKGMPQKKQINKES